MSAPSAPKKSPMNRPGFKFTAVFVAGALIGVLSAFEIVPNFSGTSRDEQLAAAESDALTPDLGTDPLATDVSKDGKGAGKGAGPSDPSATGDGSVPGAVDTDPATPGVQVPPNQPLPPSRKGLSCAAGKNGGATDDGVTGSEIKLATTVVESGTGAAFLGEVRYAMEAVKNEVNAAGGICGRQLSIEYRDDAWSAQTGAQYLRNFIEEGIFAIPVAPSSEGLRVVIDSGDIDQSGIPVVGTDGMLQNQYTRSDGSAQPWVWPVAAATVSSARIMAKEAYRRGARDFSVVFDKNYRFGVEAAAAFNQQVKALTGDSIDGYNSENSCREKFCGIIAGQSSYSGDVATFQEGDFVALFLEPQTALAWMRDPNASAVKDVKYGYGAAQPLFTRGFAVNCEDKCHGMRVWTGFKPPIENYQDDSAVKGYVEDLKRTKPDADEFNAFTQGAYVGMLLLVDALKRVGPELTRERLKVALDSTSLGTGLSLQPKLAFTPRTRFSNTTMQAFTIQYPGTFAGWTSGPIERDTGV